MTTTLTDREKIAAWGSWPYWPVLPMKRFRGWRLEVGVITADYPHVVIDTDMWSIDRNKLVIHQLSNDGKVFREGEDITTVYEDVQAMLDDGWMVD